MHARAVCLRLRNCCCAAIISSKGSVYSILKPIQAVFPVLSYYNAAAAFSTFDDSTLKVAASKHSEGKDRFEKLTVREVVHAKREDDVVRVTGWVKALRKLKSNTFIEISDGSCPQRLSIVCESNQRPKDLTMHAAIDVFGILQKSPLDACLLELKALQPIKVSGPCEQKTYPLGGKVRYTDDHVRQYLHLRPKTNRFSSMMRLRSSLSRAVHEYFHNNNFVQVHTPVITANDCEGAGETFLVKPSNVDLINSMKKESNNPGTSKTVNPDEVFFDSKSYLTVSSQLHLEAAANGLAKVWTFSPVFRAENCKSTRHLSEFYMIEAEEAFVERIEELLNTMESLLKFCIHRIVYDESVEWNQYTKNNRKLKDLLEAILKNPFTIMTFTEAKEILSRKLKSEVEDDTGLNRDQELQLVETLNNGIPVFLINWPSKTKPFYVRRNQSESIAYAVDMLVPSIGELCGGSLREHDISKLDNRLSQDKDLTKIKSSLEWYLDIRKFGGAPSAGFGLGFDRLLQLLLGCENIKDVCFIPRWPHHCTL